MSGVGIGLAGDGAGVHDGHTSLVPIGSRGGAPALQLTPNLLGIVLIGLAAKRMEAHSLVAGSGDIRPQFVALDSVPGSRQTGR
jgi:hypothetical protein